MISKSVVFVIKNEWQIRFFLRMILKPKICKFVKKKGQKWLKKYAESIGK